MMLTRPAVVSFLAMLAMLGCASTQPGPFFQDDRYLRFGVDPNDEAKAVIEGQKARNYVLAQRQLGRHFTALGFMDKQGRSSAVRVLTARGIAIALDHRPATPLEAETRYALLAAPIEGTYDADKDGFEEVFIEERSEVGPCVQVHRVRDTGAVDRVLVETRVWAEDVCPRAVIDLDGDAVVELVTEVELSGFSAGSTTLRMPLPLWAAEHRFLARAGTAPQRAWLTAERTRREAELQRARAKLDVTQSYVLGVELAALEHVAGEEPAAQLAAFDRALRGLVLSPREAAATLTARNRIYATWNEPARPLVPASEVTASVQPDANEAKPAANDRAQSSKAELADERPRAASGIQVRPVRRRRPDPLPEPAPPPFWERASDDQPVLADGEFIITPEGGALDRAKRRTTAPPVGTSEPAPAAPPPSASVADRAALRELGNAAFEARRLAAVAREAAAAARRDAHAARIRAAQAGDPAVAAELRKVVAEHVAAAERHAAEAAAHAAAAERHRDARLELKRGGEGVDVTSSQ